MPPTRTPVRGGARSASKAAAHKAAASDGPARSRFSRAFGRFGAGSKTAAKGRTNTITAFIRDVRQELRKVEWPSREEATKLTAAVVGLSAVVGIFLGGDPPRFGHNGSNPGFDAVTVALCDTGDGAVILMNGNTDIEVLKNIWLEGQDVGYVTESALGEGHLAKNGGSPTEHRVAARQKTHASKKNASDNKNASKKPASSSKAAKKQGS